MTERKLYRVITRRTGSLQPDVSFWKTEVLYCGFDRDEARRVYHAGSPYDISRGYGSPCTETVSEVIDDAGTKDFADDSISEMPPG